MKKIKYLVGALLLTGNFVLTGCNDDDVAMTQVNATLNISSNIGNDLTVKTGSYTFTNVSPGTETTVDYGATLTRAAAESTLASLTDGLYNVAFVGTATYTYTETQIVDKEEVEVEKSAEVNIQGSQQNVEVKGGNVALNLTVYVQNKDEKGNFVIAEIFSGGSLYPETNRQYNGDQYIRIYNNSSETLYADGLVLLESKFSTTQKFEYTPDIMAEAMVAQSVVRIPGSGKEHPVLPGESIILCDNAINHTEALPSSIDLSNADFEWYTIGTSSLPDVDNPDVPNMEMLFNYSKTIWVLSKQGNRAYAIGRIPENISTETYIKDYEYKATYENAGKTMNVKDAYKFPNEWIIDAINLSPKSAYVWNVISPALDMGYSYIGERTTVVENAGKAIVRKVSYTTEDGRTVLQDTNNSSVDFQASVRATLLPAQ